MSADESENYHYIQIKTISDTAADLITALTITSTNEALGLIREAKKLNMPVVISFTKKTNGKLPSGETLQNAIETIDKETYAYPFYYMINCAHPTQFQSELIKESAWLKRIGGVRANASCKSHVEPDECTELDSGNPKELGQHYK